MRWGWIKDGSGIAFLINNENTVHYFTIFVPIFIDVLKISKISFILDLVQLLDAR